MLQRFQPSQWSDLGPPYLRDEQAFPPYEVEGLGWAQIVSGLISAAASLVTPAIGQKGRTAEAENQRLTAMAQSSAEQAKLLAAKEKTKSVLYVVGAVGLLGVGGFIAYRLTR